MEVLTQENNTGAMSRQFVRSGVAGNYKIIYEMIRIIRHSIETDKGVETVAKDILLHKGLDSYSPQIEQLKAVYEFTRDHVAFVLDKAGLIESLKSARVTLSDGYGDCDDLTNVIATLAGDLGFETIKIAMARYSKQGTTFEHVYPVIYTTDGQRVVVDASLPAKFPFGYEVPAVEIKEIGVFDSVSGLDGIGGLWNNLVHHGKKLGRAVIDTVPVATEFLPLGFVTSQAFAGGAQLLNKSAGQDLSVNATGSKINQELDRLIVDLIRSRIALDLAQSHALQMSSQLSAVKNAKDDPQVYHAVKNSITTKLNFIRNFESFASEHNIPVVILNPSAMLAVGLAGAGVGAYAIYKHFSGKKEIF